MDSRIAELRKSYERFELDENACELDPLRQFERWFDQAVAAEVPEPNAMTLATVGPDGRPSTRIVLVKGVDARGLAFYTHYDSRKGLELSHQPFAALQFHWVELERVVRIEGRVGRVSEAESDAYFDSRPLGSRIGAWASPQSQVIASRAALAEAVEQVTARLEAGAPLSRPPRWGGLRLEPDTWEFWQGRRSRLHDRLRFRSLGPAGWVRERLAP